MVSGNEITDRALMAMLARSPLYEPVWFDPFALAADGGGVSPRTIILNNTDLVVNCIAGNPRKVLAATKALFDLARRTPPRRIIHLSSMAVYGGATGLVDEKTRSEPPLNPYAKARIECENIAREYVADGGDAAIVRPTCVFGPGSDAWSGRIARLLESRRLGDLGPLGDGICNLIGVDDLVATIMAMLSAPDISGETFNACADWPQLTWNEFLIRFARAIGATPVQRFSARRLRVEVEILTPILRAASLVAGRVGLTSSVPDAITPSLLRLFRQDITISSTKAATCFGLAYQPFEQAMNATAHWWRSQSSRPAGASSTPIAIYTDRGGPPFSSHEEAQR